MDKFNLSFWIMIGTCYAMITTSQSRKKCVETIPKVCDYVIVGAGAAGATVAARLSEDPYVKVCLFEAGIKDTESSLAAGIETPRLWPAVGLFPGEVNWNHTTVPQRGLKNRVLFTGMGRTYGGSTSHNAMVYFRGFKEDFDFWAASGADGWSFKDVVPFFSKFENFQIPERSQDPCGPVTITQSPNTVNTPLYKLFAKTAAEMEIPIVECDEATPFGLCIIQSTIKSGQRVSTATAFLHPNTGRQNLFVFPEALVGKILISRKHKRAYGIKVYRHGEISYVRARREIIISAGAFESPKLLHLSGIGPRDVLRKLKISPVQILPVGENSHDHVLLALDLSVDVSTPTLKTLTDPNVLAEYIFKGTGFYAQSTRTFNIFFDLEREREFNRPEVQILFVGSKTGGSITSENLRNGMLPVYEKTNERNGTTFVFFLAHPKSRGTVRAKSRDPRDLPLIDQQFLTNIYDVRTLIKGIRRMQRLVRSPAMREVKAEISILGEIPNDCKWLQTDSDAQWECVLRSQAEAVQHPVSTCKMGRKSDRASVVDPHLRVKGIDGLRVADASVMPEVTSANIMSPTIMIGERAADFIKKQNKRKYIKKY